jgi:hypothetical protein
MQVWWRKIKVNNRYKFHTDLSSFWASSPAYSRPPLAQIWVINLFPMLRASPRILTKSNGDRLKFGLFTILACVHPALKNVAAMSREANRAQKSPCPGLGLNLDSERRSPPRPTPGLGLNLDFGRRSPPRPTPGLGLNLDFERRSPPRPTPGLGLNLDLGGVTASPDLRLGPTTSQGGPSLPYP